MDKLRFATPAEVELIKFQSDLDPRLPGMVVAFENGAKQPDLAVVKLVSEMDPVFFGPETSDRRKVQFMWALTNHLRLANVPVVYFNIAADDTVWQDVAKNFGAEQTTPVPVVRYKIQLHEIPEAPDGHKDSN